MTNDGGSEAECRFEARIRDRVGVLDKARARMAELNQFIEGHATIGTDEEHRRVQECYAEYEVLMKESQEVRKQLEVTVDECARETGVKWQLKVGDDFSVDLKRG